jgi:hypothetical protein
MESLDVRRRMARRLIATTGRGLGEAAGLTVTNSPGNLLQLLCLSILLDQLGAYRPAGQATLAMRNRGWDSAARLARSSLDERLDVLRSNGAGRRARGLATTFGDLAQTLMDRYAGDLRRLRTQANREPSAERRLLRELPGVRNGTVDLFFREVQGPWREVAPFVDKRVLATARKLGLGDSVADLTAVTGGVGSEKLAWLAGALARVEMDNRYNEVRELARA